MRGRAQCNFITIGGNFKNEKGSNDGKSNELCDESSTKQISSL